MNLIQNELMRAWLLAKRTPFHYALGCLFLAAFFFAFQAGYRYVDAGTHDGAVNAYIIWLIAASGLSFASGEIEKDIQKRVLQHIYLSGSSLQLLTAVRSGIGIIHSVAVVVVVALLIALISGGVRFDFRLTSFVAIIDAVVIGLAFGWASSGVALLFRPTPLVLLPVQFLLMISVAIHDWHPGWGMWITLLLPLTPASIVLSSGNLTLMLGCIMGIQAIVYVGLGVFALQFCEALARRRGSLMA